VICSEIGLTLGQKASSVRAIDDVESRKGYSGLYAFGAVYNPGEFISPTSATPQSGYYLLYWKASQALWRVNPQEARGLDATFAFDWSPQEVNQNNTQLTAGLRLNEPLPLGIHNTMSLGYVRTSVSPEFPADMHCGHPRLPAAAGLQMFAAVNGICRASSAMQQAFRRLHCNHLTPHSALARLVAR